MNTKERFQAILNFQSFDRLPVIEWAGWWDKTIQRWYNEGLPKTLQGRDIMRHLGLDIHYQQWFNARTSDLPEPAYHGAGRISNMDEYNQVIQFLYPEPDTNNYQWEQWVKEQNRGEAIIWLTLEGFFWFPRVLLGIERHLYAFYDQPELIHRINSDLVEYNLKVIDIFCNACHPVFMTFAEDMSYNHGPMISRELFNEFMKPYYQKLTPKLKEYGVKVIIDSDGDITTPSEWFLEAGIDGILPLERQAGVDIPQLRKLHPEQLYIGGYDKMTMSRGEDAMRKEFERLIPTAREGGFIISCDHQTPPEVSLDDYKTYIRLFKEYA